MTSAIPHPIPTAIAAIDSAAASLQAVIRVTDSINRLQESIALLMLAADIDHAMATLHQCSRALGQSGEMQ